MVSIRDRHRWRAIQANALARATKAKFQSAPAIDGGRSLGGVGGLVDAGVVSIRARHRWRAILPQASACAAVVEFQSAPAIDGGRSWWRGW